MNVREMMSSPACMRLVVTLLHFLWQGLAIALVAMVAAKAFGRRSSRIRYSVHVAALFAMVVAVAVTYAVVHVPAASPTKPGARSVEVATVPVLTAGAERAAAPVGPALAHTERIEHAEGAGVSGVWQRVTPYAVAVHLAGVVLMLGRLFVGLHGGRRLQKRSRPVEDAAILTALARQARALGLSITPAIAYCTRVVVPTVVGVLRPMVLLPFSFATGLAPEQIEALLAHELAHVRRLDPLVNVAQRVIEALLFFHPAVWFVSHRIRVEREHCCDDLVVGAGANVSTYASSLVEAAERGLLAGTAPRPVPQGVGLADRPSRLRARVQRLLSAPPHPRMRLRWSWLTGLMLAAVVGIAAFALLGGTLAGEDATAGDEGSATGSGADAREDSCAAAAPEETPSEKLLDLSGLGVPANSGLRVESELLLVEIARDAFKAILEKTAPDSGDPKTSAVILDRERAANLRAALVAMKDDPACRFLSAPRVTTLDSQTALVQVVDENEDGSIRSGIRFACTPIVSADRKNIALVVHSKSVAGESLGSIRFGDVQVAQPGAGDGALLAVYRIPNGGTLLLEGAVEDDETMVYLALLTARTIEGAAGGSRLETAVSPPPATEGVSEARQRIIDKLDKRIPQVDFTDAPLREVINFLSRQMGVKIVLDPKLLADAGADGNDVTLALKDVPFRDVLKYVLMQKGLTFVVEDDALVVVPLDDAAREDRAVGAAAKEAAESRARLVKKLATRIPHVDFLNAPLKEVLNFLGREMGVNIVLNAKAFSDAGADGNVTLQLKDVPFRDVLKFLLRQKGLTFVVEDYALVVVPLDDAAREDGGVEPAAEEVAAALARIVKKLNTRIPQVDFTDAPLKEVINFLGREMGVNIVIDPKVLAAAGADGNVTLQLKDAPFRDVLKHLLAQKGLKFVVEDHAIVVVPEEEGAGEMIPNDDGWLGELETARFRVSTRGARIVKDAEGGRKMTAVEELIRHPGLVSWPEGSSIVYDEPTQTLIVTNTRLNMIALREAVKVYRALQDDPPPDPGDENAGEALPDDGPSAEEFKTVIFRLSGDGIYTTTDADGKRRVVTIDERLRRAQGVVWPAGSNLHFHRLNGALIVTNTAENMKLIRELVKKWDTPPADLDDETSLEFGIQIMRLDAAAYARIKKTVLGERDDWRKPSLVLNAEGTSALISALNADPSSTRTYMTTVAPTTSGQAYRGSVADPDDESAVLYDIAYTASVLPDSKGFKLVLDPQMAEGEFGCLFHIDAGVLVRSDADDEGRQAIYELKHGDTVLLEGVEENEDGLIDVAFMHVRVFDMDALPKAHRPGGN